MLWKSLQDLNKVKTSLPAFFPSHKSYTEGAITQFPKEFRKFNAFFLLQQGPNLGSLDSSLVDISIFNSSMVTFLQPYQGQK